MTEKKDRIADSVSRLIKDALTPKSRTGSIMGKLADQFAKAKSGAKREGEKKPPSRGQDQ